MHEEEITEYLTTSWTLRTGQRACSAMTSHCPDSPCGTLVLFADRDRLSTGFQDQFVVQQIVGEIIADRRRSETFRNASQSGRLVGYMSPMRSASDGVLLNSFGDNSATECDKKGPRLPSDCTVMQTAHRRSYISPTCRYITFARSGGEKRKCL